MVSLPAAYRVFRGFIAMVAMLWPLAFAPSLRGEEPPSYRWIKVTGQAPFAARDGAGALVFHGRMWLLGGWNPGDRGHFPRICNNEVWSSGDGARWTLIKPNTFRDDRFDPTRDWEGRHTAGYAVFRDRMWIIGGDVNQGHYHDDVWSSADGQTWTRENAGKPVPWGPRALHHTVAFRDKIWVMGGQTVPQLAPAPEAIHRDIWNSADGVAWTRVVPEGPLWEPRGMIGGAAVFQGRMWILGGGTYDTPQTPVRKFYNDVWSSADGVRWTRHLDRAPWAARQYHEVAVFDDRLWVLEGYSGENRNDVWHSADGVRWHQVPDTPWAPRHAASVFVHDHALWVVAGNNMEPDVWKLVRSGKATVDPEKAPRESREIATGWRFQIDTHDLGEKDRWFDPGLDRSAWAQAEVPRAWDTFDESLRGFEGIGWYAVTIDGSWAREGKLQRLALGRVMYHTKVWLNGECLGEHTDGYLPFAFDVTGKLKTSENHLVLRVDNRPRIEWMPAGKQIEWVQYGGILQPVRLETRGKTAIADLAIRAVPRGSGASVHCDVEMRSADDAGSLVLRAGVEGYETAARQVEVHLQGDRSSHQELDLTLETAEPWSPESPRMYTLVATLERAGKVIDRVSTPFGIRTIEARGRQLLLNGKPLKVRGVNRYDEFGRFGPNPPWPLVEEELRLMKRTGINMIRTHYPQHPEFLSLCDRMGILFLEELPINWWGIEWFGKEGVVQNESILKQALPMLETMIRRDRNHPCVIIWSMANESKTDNEVGIKVMRTLLRRTKELDRTRLATFVTAPSSVREHRAYEDADLVAFNMYPGSLGGPLVDHLDQLEERARKPAAKNIRTQLTAFPDKPMIVTEYGAMGFRGLRGGVPSSEDFQAAYIKTIWDAIAGDPELSGGVLWSWADYHHRRNFLSLGAFGAFGVVTIDRQPKAALRALAEAYGGTAAR